MQIPNWLLSSTGEGIALRWKALAAAAVPTALLVAPLFGFQIEALEANEFVDVVSKLILGVTDAMAALVFIAAFARRNWNKRFSLGKFARSAEPLA